MYSRNMALVRGMGGKVSLMKLNGKVLLDVEVSEGAVEVGDYALLAEAVGFEAGVGGCFAGVGVYVSVGGFVFGGFLPYGASDINICLVMKVGMKIDRPLSLHKCDRGLRRRISERPLSWKGPVGK